MGALANVGLTAGFAISGAYLTALGFFRSDSRIALEEATYVDGGDTRIACMMANARVGRLGVIYTAASVVLSSLTDANASMLATITAAATTTAILVGSGHLFEWSFWKYSRNPKVVTARRVIEANRAKHRAA